MGEPFVTPLFKPTGLSKICGAPLSSRCLRIFTGAVWTAKLSICQSVPQPGALRPNGSPLVQRFTPDHCQPPINTSTSRFEELANICPVPKGKWYNQSKVIKCLVSKSETPRF